MPAQEQDIILVYRYEDCRYIAEVYTGSLSYGQRLFPRSAVQALSVTDGQMFRFCSLDRPSLMLPSCAKGRIDVVDTPAAGTKPCAASRN